MAAAKNILGKRATAYDFRQQMRQTNIRILHVSSYIANRAKTVQLNVNYFFYIREWSGGAMVLGKLPAPGRPTIWMIVGQGPIALAVGAGEGLFGHFYSPLSLLLFLPLSGRWSDID